MSTVIFVSYSETIWGHKEKILLNRFRKLNGIVSDFITGFPSVSASARLSLSQPMCLNLIFGMLSCMFFLCSKFNKDYN